MNTENSRFYGLSLRHEFKDQSVDFFRKSALVFLFLLHGLPCAMPCALRLVDGAVGGWWLGNRRAGAALAPQRISGCLHDVSAVARWACIVIER